MPKQPPSKVVPSDDTTTDSQPDTVPCAASAADDGTLPSSRPGTVSSADELVAPKPAAAAPEAPAAPAGKPVGTAGPQGKQPAAFKMKPSKETKKMELGEAYLLAQTQKTATLAVQLAAKCRADMIVSLAGAGKTPDEIRDLLALLIAA